MSILTKKPPTFHRRQQWTRAHNNMSADSKHDTTDQVHALVLQLGVVTGESVEEMLKAFGYVIKQAQDGHGDYKFEELKVALRLKVGTTIGNVDASGDAVLFGGGRVGNITCKGRATVMAFNDMQTGDISGDGVTRICIRRDPTKCCVMTATTVQAPVVHVGKYVHSRVEKLVTDRVEIEPGGELIERGVVVEPT